jgi:hypothetical protein
MIMFTNFTKPISSIPLKTSPTYSRATTTGLGGTLFPPMGSGTTPAAVENKNDAKALKESAVPNDLYQVKHFRDELAYDFCPKPMPGVLDC